LIADVRFHPLAEQELRRHRAIENRACRDLGSHQGLPVTIIATATLDDLQNKTGIARTGGGTLLPVKDVIRLATPAQRLVLYANAK
jgi:hypothetical protein